MKKLVFSAALVLSLGLAACGEEKTTGESKEETQTPASAETEKVQKEESKSDDNEVKEGPLTKAGQWTMDGEDKVTLVKIKEVNQTYKQGPINLTIESVKLLHHSNISNETKEYLKNVSGKDVTELNTIQLIYKMENTVDDNVMMTAIDTITTDTKAQINGYDSMSLNEDTGSYAGQVIVNGMAIFPYFNGSLEDINTVFINTGMTFNSDSGTNLGDSQRIEIAF
ncbi:lipoprotein [Lysinibacillus capsici]|uniref:Lipoprotein n=1 Tax=Lysinibacillus capsici TaxID=2115968 RepID=A0A2X0XP74_9BACI|nr:hypothetical protein [Lysinibacillus capsici]SPT95538.1 lipoprotein [Lysinibacillus capsici]